MKNYDDNVEEHDDDDNGEEHDDDDTVGDQEHSVRTKDEII